MENEDLWERLSRSNFRSRFCLNERDKLYIREKGRDVILQHAYDFIRKRLAPSYIPNDGKQTPMRGHPVFIAQHATGTCCRGCLWKWHYITPDKMLSNREIDFIVMVIMEWIDRQMSLEMGK